MADEKPRKRTYTRRTANSEVVIAVKKPAKKRTYTRGGKRATTYRRNAGGKGPRVMRGYGDYETWGGQVGANLGSKLGGFLGHGLHGIIKNLTGFGDYQVHENSLMTLGGDPPRIMNTPNNSHIIHHREYITDVYASQAFQVTQYPLNPGLLVSFPWASQVAQSYEQYKMRGVVFEYKSMCADNVLSTAASTALGTVIMSTQYNALDTPFQDKRTMENYEYANSCKPSCSMLHPIECKMSQSPLTELYVRDGPITVGDQRMYDLGTFAIAVQGMQNTGSAEVIGELWVSFEIEFFKPKLLPGGTELMRADHFYGTGTSNFTSAAPFGGQGAVVARSDSNLGCVITIAGVAPYANNSIIFPSYVTSGFYQIQYILGGTVATAVSPNYTASGTAVNVDVISSAVKILVGAGDSSYVNSPQPGITGSSQYMLTQILQITQTVPGTQAGYAVVFTAGAMPTGVMQLDIIISELPDPFN